jgi:hypothetical protein
MDSIDNAVKNFESIGLKLDLSNQEQVFSSKETKDYKIEGHFKEGKYMFWFYFDNNFSGHKSIEPIMTDISTGIFHRFLKETNRIGDYMEDRSELHLKQRKIEPWKEAVIHMQLKPYLSSISVTEDSDFKIAYTRAKEVLTKLKIPTDELKTQEQ